MATKKDAELTGYQRSEPVTIHRRQIKNAPYNPRKIVESARKKLLENIEKVGLLGGIVWNDLTGNLVSGHQRIGVLDSLHRSQDYLLRVEKVSLDDATERQQNLFMNNPSAQGDWDMDKLEGMLKSADFNIEAAGFNLEDVYKVFGFSPLVEQPEHLAKLAEEMRAVKDRHRLHQNRMAKEDINEIGYYRVLVFESTAEADAWCEENGLPSDTQFLQGRGLKLVRDAEIKEGS